MSQESIWYKKNMLLTLGLWVVFGTCAMAVMLYTALHKTIVIADSATDNRDIFNISATGHGVEEEGVGTELAVAIVSDDAHRVFIPLPEDMQADAVTIENRYMQRQLWIYLHDVSLENIQEGQVVADDGVVETARAEEISGGVVVKFQMTDVYEYVSTMESGGMYVSCFHPHELYEKIVVVDPKVASDIGAGWNDLTETDVTLQVALMLQQKLQDKDCKLYFTRIAGEAAEPDECVALARAIDADLYVSLSLSGQDDESVYGIEAYYNADYFIPDFGNVQWADALTRNVTIAAGNRANGLFPATDDSVLMQLNMPAAEISLGHISNEQERGLLLMQDYRGQLAEGLANALTEVYTNQ